METWGKWTFGGKGYPKCPKRVFQVPLSPFLQNFYKWAPRPIDTWGNGHLDKGYPKCPNIPGPISPQMFANGQWGKWALGKNGHLEERSTPSALCPLPLNV